VSASRTVIELREATEADWPHILRCADEAAPAAVDNDVWLANRRAFAATGRMRRHYVALDGATTVTGYGAIEEDAVPGRFRLFVVTRPDRLESGAGARLFQRLMLDLGELRANVAWMRERLDDPLVAFAIERGFRDAQRVDIDGTPAVILDCPVRVSDQE